MYAFPPICTPGKAHPEMASRTCQKEFKCMAGLMEQLTASVKVYNL